MPKGPHLSPEVRAACVVMHFHGEMQYVRIAEKLNLKPGTVRNTCARIRKVAGSTNLLDLLQHCGTCPRSGRPLKIAPGSEEANKIRSAVKEYKYQFPKEVAQWVLSRQPLGQIDPNITISETTTRKILRDKRYIATDSTNVKPIVRKRQLRKNILTEKHLSLRKSYCDLIDKWYEDNALVITADEYQEHFGGSGLHRINADKGSNSYGSKAPIRFSREQWAASSDDPSVQRPHCIWEAEKATNHENWHRQLQEAKQVLNKEVRRRRARCNQEGTTEYHLLQQKNKEVDIENEKRFHRRSQGDYCGSLKYWTPTRLFPFEKIEKEEEKGGLDLLFMAFEIYRKYLFPYARDLAMINPQRQVIILEDNDSSHHKARRLLAPEILKLEEQYGVIFGPHPPNSPELALIETLHGFEHRALQDFRFNVDNARASTKREADRKMKEWWQGDTNDNLIARKSSIKRLKVLADRCRAVHFSNSFEDD